MQAEFDRIGYWSELKLDILKEYAGAYSTILAAQRNPSLRHFYIEGFSGPGLHQSKLTDNFVAGSPLNALHVQPPFHGYHLIDIEAKRVSQLRELIGTRADVFLYAGDCNEILLTQVFPLIKYEDYRRALCILDPYGLNLDWKVVLTAGQMKTVDLFINFPIMDINRNVLRRNRENVESAQVARMNAFCGDDSWREIAYRTDLSLFGEPEKQGNEVIAEYFRNRLKRVAGFARVPPPLPMRNSVGATVYYLFFASQKDTAENVIQSIFKKYQGRRR